MNKKAILQYLNWSGELDDKHQQLIDECILEVSKIAHFPKLFINNFRSVISHS